MDQTPCTFVYSGGKRCAGHIVRVEAYKADLVWERGADGRWAFDFRPRSHYHLFCSLKGNHAGSLRPDDAQMKFDLRWLPEELRLLIQSTNSPQAPPDAS